MIDDPVHKKSLITPSSWREGHKVAEAIVNSMSGKKVETTDVKKGNATWFLRRFFNFFYFVFTS